MLLDNISPFVRRAWDAIEKAPWALPDRSIYDYELMFVKEGEVEVTIEDTVYHGIPGDIFLIKPRQLHSMRLIGSTPLRQPHVHFDLIYQPDSPELGVGFLPFEQANSTERKCYREDLLTEGPMKLPNFIRLQQPTIVQNLIFVIINEWCMKLPYYEQACKGLIIQLLSTLLRETSRPEYKSIPSTREVLTRLDIYMHLNKDRVVTLEELAEITHISPHHLIRQFKKLYGITPIQYHHTLRMQRARELLKFTVFSISQIAEQLGFSNVTMFSRTFTKSEGLSPTSFRKLKRQA